MRRRKKAYSKGFYLFSALVFTALGLLRIGEWRTLYTTRNLFSEMGADGLWANGLIAALVILAAALNWMVWFRYDKQHKND